MIKKIFIQGKYVVITENGKEIFSAPISETRVKTEDSDTVRIYNETNNPTNYKNVVVDIDKLKDADGNTLEGGTFAWLRENTGFNTASGGSGAELNPDELAGIQNANGLSAANPAATMGDISDKTDKGGYEGTAQDLKDEIDGAVSGYRGTIEIADTPTEDGVYTPTEAGTYTNAGGLVYAPETTDQGKFVQFIKTGANWVKHTVSGGAYSKNETDVYRTLMESDILNSNQITTMVGGLPSTIEHKRDGTTIRTDTYTFTDNQVVESRELPTGEKVTITTNTLTLTTDIIYYGI